MLENDDFLRRRKLRLQQVREQSKDIAKKIRQRTKIEKYRHIMELDAKKEKEYVDRQEKIVEELERQHALNVKNIGAGHIGAMNLLNQEVTGEKIDLSKKRGKVAAVELRQKKQQVLDEKKKLLDRKLQAREVANELSREKGASVANKLKVTDKVNNQAANNNNLLINDENRQDTDTENIADVVNLIDMSVQCNGDSLPKEGEGTTKTLLENNNAGINRALKSNNMVKKPNLFALSDEMPSCLRASKTYIPEEPDLFKPSNIIANYLQNRGMRLREPDIINKTGDNLQNIKETIIKTRATKEGKFNICKVLDKDLNPVPSWHMTQSSCHFCTNKQQLNNEMCTKVPKLNLKESSRFRTSKSISINRHSLSARSVQYTTSSSTTDKKNPVIVYDHSTRDTNTVNVDNRLVDRDIPTDNDAYLQAVKQTSAISNSIQQGDDRKLREHRHKVAVSKERVEKEYKDTIAFLNMLPKQNESRPIKEAYMPECRQQLQREKQQKKMQQEYKIIEKQSRRHCTTGKHSKHKKCSKSATIEDYNEDNISDDINISNQQYSWIPVPESDHSLAIHKIPNKENKQTVTFDENCSYHEYRSKHRHTPPTKDRDSQNIEVEESDDNSSNSQKTNNTNVDDNTTERSESGAVSDKNRIIIYKILDSQLGLSDIGKTKLTDSVVTSITSLDKEIRSNLDVNNDESKKRQIPDKPNQSLQSLDKITEGIYKVVTKSQNNSIMKCQVTNIEKESWRTIVPYKSWWDNIDQTSENIDSIEKENNSREHDKVCKCKHSSNTKKDENIVEGKQDWKNSGAGDSQIRESNTATTECPKCKGPVEAQINTLRGAPESDTSLKTKKVDNIPKQLQFADGTDGNFYIGASGCLKDDDYEVIIQLRKKESKSKEINVSTLNHVVQTEDILTKSATAQTESDKCIQNHTEFTKEPIINESAQTLNIKEIILDNNNDKLTEQDASKTFAKKQATMYTQTSFNTPTQKPVYYHMSSSTSTTYMSPPDVIIPKFLKPKNKGNTNFSNATVDETDESYSYIKHANIQEQTKAKAHKCNKHKKKESNRQLTSTRHKNNHFKEPTIENLNLNYRNLIKSGGSNLNSAMKNYVNRVLELNKDGVRVLEVATQYCSSVSTPGSSIVNISSNVDKKANYVEQLSDKISQNILKKIGIENDNSTQSQVQYKRKRHLKLHVKKPKHKVKSLNVSRNLAKHFNKRKLSTQSSRPSTSSTSNIEHTNKHTIPVTTKIDSPKPSKIKDNKTKKSAESTSDNLTNNDETSLNFNKKKMKCNKTKKPKSYNHHDFFQLQEQLNRIQPTATCTQTSEDNISVACDSVIMQLEKDKIQNMEKISVLTQKCTKRLFNLARVLEQVRKNNNTAYISSDTSSDADKHELVKPGPLQVPQNVDDNLTSDHVLKNIQPKLPQPHEMKDISRTRCKPPPVLSRAHLKYSVDVIPHELSTVPEADSPMSQKTRKSQSPNSVSRLSRNFVTNDEEDKENLVKNPDILANNINSVDISNFKMLNLKEYNELMLKPFLTLEDYVKQCNVGTLDEGSNFDDVPKEEVHDEISSLHSDGSLPDVISELLKRNIISEPFRPFDSISNCALSSDSSASMLSKSKATLKIPKNNLISDTSDSLDIPSNPDLEKSLEKLGMGWASSTLKKTKERQALSSSSSTSTSISLKKTKRPSKIDSLSKDLSEIKLINPSNLRGKVSRHVEQQTSMPMPMTVKEFLSKELSKKITFINDSKEATEHFTSLYSTKLPAEFDATTEQISKSPDIPAGSRQRTSTPVQLFKSMNYNTNSSSNNNSNGIFSNLDELSSVKVTSSSLNDKDGLNTPNYSLRLKRDKSQHNTASD